MDNEDIKVINTLIKDIELTNKEIERTEKELKFSKNGAMLMSVFLNQIDSSYFDDLNEYLKFNLVLRPLCEKRLNIFKELEQSLTKTLSNYKDLKNILIEEKETYSKEFTVNYGIDWGE